MSLLFNLHYDMYNVVCSEWLDTIDMGKLDSAMCQSEYRESLLQQLNRVMENGFDNESASYYNWMYMRNIPMKKLKLSGFTYSSEKKNFLCKVRLHEVQTLHVMNMGNDVSESCLKSVVDSFPNLMELIWENNDHDLDKCVTVKNLTSLKMQVKFIKVDTIYEWIIEHCTKLHTLTIMTNNYIVKRLFDASRPTRSSLLNRAIQLNSSTLRHIHISSPCCFPSTILNCAHLESMYVRVSFKWSELSLFIKKLVTMDFAISSPFFSSRIEYIKSNNCLTIKEPPEETLLCDSLNNFEGLKVITISGDSEFTDQLLYCFVDRFSASLTDLLLPVPCQTSAHALHHLLTCCKHLESFELNYSKSVLTSTDVCNIIINAAPPHLKSLNILVDDNCSDLLINVLKSVPSLTRLHLQYECDAQNFKLLSEFIESEGQIGRDISLHFNNNI